MAKPQQKHCLASMTAFARQSGGDGALGWTWEIKSVNARGLEMRARLPAGFEMLDAPLRGRIAKRLTRGSVQINLTLDRSRAPQNVQLNQEVLAQVLAEAKRLEAEQELKPASADGLLAIRGVVEVVEPVSDPAEMEARETQLLADLELAVTSLIAARQDEGCHLQGVVEELLSEMAALTEQATSLAAAQPAAIQERLQRQLAELLGGEKPVAPERLAQEVALLATKGDVREELDRLAGHIIAARELLVDSAAIGRRFDFLCQELNRETNTLCSKSSDIELTRVGLALKAVVDRLREQVQNIE